MHLCLKEACEKCVYQWQIKLSVDDCLWCFDMLKKVVWFGFSSSFKVNAWDCKIVMTQHNYRGRWQCCHTKFGGPHYQLLCATKCREKWPEMSSTSPGTFNSVGQSWWLVWTHLLGWPLGLQIILMFKVISKMPQWRREGNGLMESITQGSKRMRAKWTGSLVAIRERCCTAAPVW